MKKIRVNWKRKFLETKKRYQEMLSHPKENRTQADAFRKYDDPLHGKTDKLVVLYLIGMFVVFFVGDMLQSLLEQPNWKYLSWFGLANFTILAIVWFKWYVRRYHDYLRKGLDK